MFFIKTRFWMHTLQIRQRLLCGTLSWLMIVKLIFASSEIKNAIVLDKGKKETKYQNTQYLSFLKLKIRLNLVNYSMFFSHSYQRSIITTTENFAINYIYIYYLILLSFKQTICQFQYFHENISLHGGLLSF